MVEDNVIQKDEKDVEIPISENNANMNVTVILEEIPDFKQKVTELETESDLVEDEAESIKKPVQKKVSKTKLKSKKQTVEEDSKTLKTRKRAASEDRQVVKVEEKVVSKSRKRPVDKILPESLKPVSPSNELPKRNRRAASVDILTYETASYPSDKVPKKNKVNSKSTKSAIVVTEDDALKKQKKGTKKEDQPKVMETKDDETKILEKNSKGKKITKKVLNEEKENVTTEQNDVEAVLNSNQEKPKSKRGIKKVKIDEPVEDEEKVPKPSSRSRVMPKVIVKQNSEKDLEKKQKTVPKTKKIVKSPENFEESSEINETDDSNKSPEIKPKRERKFKQNDLDQKDDNFKEIKSRKRGGRKPKVEDFDEEVQQKSPLPVEHEINLEFEDLADDLPDTPESEKEEVKPIAAKRKTKAKSRK